MAIFSKGIHEVFIEVQIKSLNFLGRLHFMSAMPCLSDIVHKQMSIISYLIILSFPCC